MATTTPLARWLRSHLKALAPRTRSLVVTVFGDSVEPHGGSIWLGSLACLLQPLGVLDRAVRTAVFRLVKEGWLELASDRSGRRSHYRLTVAGRQRAAHAHRRIYDSPANPWSGNWTLLLLEQSASPALRHDLQWQGFGRLAANLYAHPAPDLRALEEIVASHGANDGIVGLRASALELPGAQSPSELVRRGWPLDDLARQYNHFVETFGAIPAMLADGTVTDEQHFVLRTLLIHEFRRAQLRDPRLPAQLLPAEWPGRHARALCSRIYLACAAGAERHLLQTAEGPEGPLRPAAPYYFERFTDRAGART